MSYSLYDIIEYHESAMESRRLFGLSTASAGKRRVGKGRVHPKFGRMENGAQINAGDLVGVSNLDKNVRVVR